ncbi:hypothetical protein Pmani_014865 [Petrolisthes manimaculis]|uniref:Uncharacterized protein n=1 Tax=Petrolisthes manimaculis TaxID=1843537 RepID=A0AAE1PVM4_9EUCA|nr:hypothetical protein Pmani_014865 [Petrolisthes manimaculis]
MRKNGEVIESIPGHVRHYCSSDREASDVFTLRGTLVELEVHPASRPFLLHPKDHLPASYGSRSGLDQHATPLPPLPLPPPPPPPPPTLPSNSQVATECPKPLLPSPTSPPPASPFTLIPSGYRIF